MAEQKSFWNSVPRYLTGFAALLTALVAGGRSLSGANQIGVIITGVR